MSLQKIEPSQSDLRAIAALYQECFNEPGKGENWTPETAYQYFQDRVSEDSVFAILNDDKKNLIGVCCGSDYKTSFISEELDYDFESCFYISLIAISENFRGQGLGTKIISEYCSLIEELGFQTVLVRCRAENVPILHILNLNGFDEIHRYISELGGVTCERVVLKKGL